MKIAHDMRGQRSRAGTSTDARMITYDSRDAFLSVLTPKSTKWCQMHRKVRAHVKGQGQGKLPGPQFSVKCPSTHIRFSCLFGRGCARVCIPEGKSRRSGLKPLHVLPANPAQGCCERSVRDEASLATDRWES